MTRRSSVTVMVPSYNYARYLTECIESAIAQDGVDVDIAIVENASTDGSPSIAHDLAARYPQVRVVAYHDNQGIISSFNRCLAEVRGDYAVLLCADDRLVPNALARLVQFLDEHPNVGLAYGPALDFARPEDVQPAQLAVPAGSPILYDGRDWVSRRCRAGTNPIRAPEAVFRSSTLDDAGLFDPACPHTSDLNMWLRLAVRQDVAFLPGPPVALYRRHADNHSIDFRASMLGDIEQRWHAFERFFETLDANPRRADWERVARRRLAGEANYIATRVHAQGGSPADVEALLRFGRSLDPSAASWAEGVSWRVRRAVGPTGSRLLPFFLPRPMLRRLQKIRAEKRRLQIGL